MTEYTVDIDGQVLRYRNTAPVWTDFVWPHAGGQPGARISGQAFDGRTLEVLNEPGRSGLERMLSIAVKRKLADGTSELSWGEGNQRVTLHFRVVRAPGPVAAPGAPATPLAANSLRGVQLPSLVAGAAAGVSVPALPLPATAAPASAPAGMRQ